MKQKIGQIALIVKEYDEAIQFYSEALGFQVLEDTRIAEDKRWVAIASPGAEECSILLAKAADENQALSVGNQTGGRVFLFLYIDDFWRDYRKMLDRSIHFIRPPKKENYGVVALFEDLYRNLWNLIQPKKDRD
jgi:catechol 2,3-dioxygenase-like lactoylglutathione lyase family enzyme